MGKKDGGSFHRTLSIRTLSAVLFAASVLAVAFSLFELRQTTRHAELLYELEQERHTCDIAIQQFMDGSDYLTTQVQQLTVQADRRYLDAYWLEVEETRSRERAVEIVLSAGITPLEREQALASKAESDALILGETWAMRMMAESMGIAQEEMPAQVAAYALDAGDAALSAREKQAAVAAYVFGPDYSMAKSVIRGHVNSFRNEIANRYSQEAILALKRTQRTSLYAVGSIAAFFLLLTLAIVCFIRQVVAPLIGFSHALTRFDRGQSIALEESGALEIRRFARAFNTLYGRVEQNTKRLERLGYVDYLTDVPNRASVTEYVESLIARDQHPLGLLIADIDDFKRFNDTYGHALGDKVLQQVARAVCFLHDPQTGIGGRLCGEEFVVAVQDADAAGLRRLGEAIVANVRHITADRVGLAEAPDFRVTISVGGTLWRGERPVDFIALLSRADKALYQSKQTGKNKYTEFLE